jgi:hypothetical protein
MLAEYLHCRFALLMHRRSLFSAPFSAAAMTSIRSSGSTPKPVAPATRLPAPMSGFEVSARSHGSDAGTARIRHSSPYRIA